MLSFLFLLATGCVQKDLQDGAPTIASNVEVVFDWSKAPDTQASLVALYLYPEGHDMLNYSFNDPQGGTIRSYGGRHTAICHSNDDPYIHHVRNEDAHDEFEIFTDNTAILVGQGISTNKIPRAPGTEDEPLRTTPTMIYGIHDKNINLKISNFPQTLTFYPEELVCHYSVEFVDVGNLKSADLRIDATISSLAGGYYPGRMAPTAEPVTQTFTLSPDKQVKSLKSEFLTFGLPAGEERPHKICLYIAFKDKTGNLYTFDVSDQVNKAPDPRNVSIKIYGLQLPEIFEEPPQGEEGISIEVDSWETYNYDLKV